MAAATPETTATGDTAAGGVRAAVGGWVDDRTGHRGALDWARGRTIVGGAKWRYATGPVSLGLFAVVFATGVALMTGYVPSADDAWASTHHLETSPGGSLVRGLHFWGTHALIVAFAVHLARLMLTAAFRSPKELAWVSGVLLFPLLVGAAVTGNPLTGSQKAFEQIQVESAILAGTPVVGPTLERLLVGGPAAGSLTLTHLYSLHVMLLPLAAGGVLAFHLYQLLRWGTVRAGDGVPRRTDMLDRDGDGEPDPEPMGDRSEAPYVPDQLSRNAIVFAAAFGLVFLLAARHPAPLDAPPGVAGEGAPRPEWYFRWLFELRNYVPPAWEFLATGVVPAALVGLLVALPWVDRLGHRVGAAVRYAVVLGGLAVWTGLTVVSMNKDRGDEHYLEVKADAAVRAARASELARAEGVPPEGPGMLLATDPRTRGPELFRQHCASCHAHTGPAAEAMGPDHVIEATDCGGANLAGFGSRAWAAGMLMPDEVDGEGYFGCTPFAAGDMTDYVQNTLWDGIEPGSAEAEMLRGQIAAVAAALAAEAGPRVHGGRPVAEEHGGDVLTDEQLGSLIARGRALMTGTAEGEELPGYTACTDCHNFAGAEDGYSCTLDGYGSREWLAGLIANPAREGYYGGDAAADGDNGYMPAYKPHAGGDPRNTLTEEEVLLLTDWLRGDWVGR